MKRCAIITNFNIYDKAGAAMRVAEELLSLGAEVLLSSVNKDKIFRMHKNRREYVYLPPEEIYAAADCIVVLGGDGSILDASRRAAPLGKPLLGINMGRLGYMAELEMGEISLLSKLIAGEFEIDERSMLSVGVYTQSGTKKTEVFALNDAVISNGSVARIVDIELYEGGELVSGYRADGMIVATPTGSTAYSMSAGGPITDPHLPCFLVTPVCPHSLTARPLLFRDDAVIELKNVCQREKMLYLTVDGRNNIEIYRGDVVRITRAEMTTRLIRLRQGGFYNRLQSKMYGHT
ncbi:MAG: NAD(+)/NADH kinase [Ruminococcaceae bacterium]|nr:NAD(+)/NADH kinase [Oscillospiraceae bacterium]